jgi:uncharacterized protein YcbK (DUF882 family)
MSSDASKPARPNQFGRRALMGGLGLLLLSRDVAAEPVVVERRIALLNTHTGERFADADWLRGAYIPEQVARLNRLLRDHHTNQVVAIDPRLFDLLAGLRDRLGADGAYEVISAYRSAQTNAAARRSRGGVARNSQHIAGKAVDVRIRGVSLATMRRAAIGMQAGGVGTYARGDFVHLDVGPVRAW